MACESAIGAPVEAVRFTASSSLGSMTTSGRIGTLMVADVDAASMVSVLATCAV